MSTATCSEANVTHALEQEVGFFDTEATSGMLMNALSEDCSAVQSAISEKVRYHTAVLWPCNLQTAGA